MALIKEIIYTRRTHTTSGRDGSARSDDGRLEIQLSPPAAATQERTPSNSFPPDDLHTSLGAIGRAAQVRKIPMPADTTVDAEADLAKTGDEFFLAARLNIKLPGIDAHTTGHLADAAHQICPYSKATRDNVEVNIRIVD